LNDKFDSYQSFLERLIELGRKQYNDRYIELLGEKHDDADNDIAVLSFLQHHGCPTPLLDWTYKFQNALFFALDGVEAKVRKKEIDDYFSVYFIEEKDFEKGGMRNLIYETIDKSQAYALNKAIEMTTDDEERRIKMREHFKGRKAIDIKRIKGSGMIAYFLKLEKMINFPVTYFADGKHDDITFSLNNSANIQNQSGVFTWNSDPTKPFEMAVNEERKTDDDQKDYVLCECFNINKKICEHVRKNLEQDGITKEFIYPTSDISTWNIYEKTLENSL
jgi:FRG domain